MNNKKPLNFWDDAHTVEAELLAGLFGLFVIVAVCIVGMMGI